MKKLLIALTVLVIVALAAQGCASKFAKQNYQKAVERAATQPDDIGAQADLAKAEAEYNESVDDSAAEVNKVLTVGAAGAAAVPGYGTLISSLLLGLTTVVGFIKNHNKKSQIAEKQIVIDELIDAAATIANAVKSGLPTDKPSPELDKALAIIGALKKAADEWSAKTSQS